MIINTEKEIKMDIINSDDLQCEDEWRTSAPGKNQKKGIKRWWLGWMTTHWSMNGSYDIGGNALCSWLPWPTEPSKKFHDY